MPIPKKFSILTQPDDNTCGPTCLHAIYNHYGDKLKMEQVIKECASLKEGGTLAVLLALHALKRGYTAKIYTYNLHVFDPSWFPGNNILLADKLKKQMKYKKSKKIRAASKAYIEFLKLGGKIIFEDLTRSLIRNYLSHETPILTGLSSTYLYRAMREYGKKDRDDDLRGDPMGHFVILHDYHRDTKYISVADPYSKNPVSRKNNYAVHIDRVIGAILLGIITYDANLLIITPEKKNQ